MQIADETFYFSNVLTKCFYSNNGRCFEMCRKNDAIYCEDDVILQKSTSLVRFPFLDTFMILAGSKLSEGIRGLSVIL